MRSNSVVLVALMALAAAVEGQEASKIVGPEPYAGACTVDVVVRSSPNPTLATFEARCLEAGPAAPYPGFTTFRVTACNSEACSEPVIYFPEKNRLRIKAKLGLLYRVEASVLGAPAGEAGRHLPGAAKMRMASP